MGSLLRNIKQHSVAIGVITVVLVVVIALIIVVSLFGWDWTGFNAGYRQETITSTNHGTTIATVRPSGKTLWDFLQLLIIPIALLVGGFMLGQIQKSNEQRTTDDNQQEAALQANIDKISELLLEKKLLHSDIHDEEIRQVARLQTLTIFRRLNGERKGYLLQFWYDAQLISRYDESLTTVMQTHDPIIGVYGADLSKVDLSGADLTDADLSEANLSKAILWRTDLRFAKLNKANLS